MNESELIIQDYNNGLTLTELTKKYHHRYEIIKKILIDNNIEIKPKGYYLKKSKQRILTEKEEQIIIDNYVNKKYGINKSGKEIGASEPVVKRILKKHNIHIRNHKESLEVLGETNRKYHINDNFFSTENPEMAYILGFLAADGTVRKHSNEVKVTLARKDRELLEKIQYLLQTNYPIIDDTTSKGYDISTLGFSSRQIKQDLALYGIVPNKTFTFCFPLNLSKQYWIDFIRGYFDGDGTICTAAKALRFSICGARRETLETIINYFEELGVPKVSIQIRQGINPLYYFQYSSKAVRQIYNILYYPNCLCLKRKFDIYSELMK